MSAHNSTASARVIQFRANQSPRQQDVYDLVEPIAAALGAAITIAHDVGDGEASVIGVYKNRAWMFHQKSGRYRIAAASLDDPLADLTVEEVLNAARWSRWMAIDYLDLGEGVRKAIEAVRVLQGLEHWGAFAKTYETSA